MQERANRNAYPMTGMEPDDVREILAASTASIATNGRLRGAGWASAIKRAARNRRAPTPRLREKLPHGVSLFRIRRLADADSAGKKAAFEKPSPPFASTRSCPIRRSNVCASCTKGRRCARTAFAEGRAAGTGGVGDRRADFYEEYWCERVAEFLKVGLGVLCLDMPGTGEAPIKIDVGAEKMY